MKKVARWALFACFACAPACAPASPDIPGSSGGAPATGTGGSSTGGSGSGGSAVPGSGGSTTGGQGGGQGPGGGTGRQEMARAEAPPVRAERRGRRRGGGRGGSGTGTGGGGVARRREGRRGEGRPRAGPPAVGARAAARRRSPALDARRWPPTGQRRGDRRRRTHLQFPRELRRQDAHAAGNRISRRREPLHAVTGSEQRHAPRDEFRAGFSKSVGSGWVIGTDGPRVTTMYNDLMENYCIDTSRVFATGHSFGGSDGGPDAVRERRRETLQGRGPGGRLEILRQGGPIPAMYIQGMRDAMRNNSNGMDVVTFFTTSNGCQTTTVPNTDVPTCNSTLDRTAGHARLRDVPGLHGAHRLVLAQRQQLQHHRRQHARVALLRQQRHGGLLRRPTLRPSVSRPGWCLPR